MFDKLAYELPTSPEQDTDSFLVRNHLQLPCPLDQCPLSPSQRPGHCPEEDLSLNDGEVHFTLLRVQCPIKR